MSYCRFGEADVYVYTDVNGYVACCGCSLSDEWRHFGTDAILAHLREHVAVGDDVPEHVFERLERDREENDAFIESAKGAA